MKISFKYDQQKDIWCLKNQGASSNNSTKPTAPYIELTETFGPNPSDNQISSFIEETIRNNFDVTNIQKEWEQLWQTIVAEYTEIAENIFDKQISKNLTAYATVNSRCPYNLDEGWFFISLDQKTQTL